MNGGERPVHLPCAAIYPARLKVAVLNNGRGKCCGGGVVCGEEEVVNGLVLAVRERDGRFGNVLPDGA